MYKDKGRHQRSLAHPTQINTSLASQCLNIARELRLATVHSRTWVCSKHRERRRSATCARVLDGRHEFDSWRMKRCTLDNVAPMFAKTPAGAFCC